MFLEKIREVEGGCYHELTGKCRDNFVADPFLDRKPMKLPKNGSDVIFFFFLFCLFVVVAFHDSSCSSHFALPVDV